MPIEFEFYESPDPTGERKSKYHARAVTLRTVGTTEIAQEIQYASSLTVGDIKGVLTELSHRIAYHLGNSERVHLEGIGYFQVSLTNTNEIDPKKTRAQSVWFKSVKFKADQELNKQLKYVRTERSELKRHSAQLTSEQIDQKLIAFFKKNSYMTRRHFEQLCGLTRITASRHIKRLTDEGKLINTNTRTHPVYVLNLKTDSNPK